MHSKSDQPESPGIQALIKKPEHREPTLEIDGHHYPLSKLPPEVHELIELYTAWEGEKKQAIREVKKLDAALRSVEIEISKRVAMWGAKEASNEA